MFSCFVVGGGSGAGFQPAGSFPCNAGLHAYGTITMTATNPSGNAASHTNLNQSVQYLQGVGPKRAEILGRIGIRTIRDVLCYFPRDSKDLTRKQKESEAKKCEEITF